LTGFEPYAWEEQIHSALYDYTAMLDKRGTINGRHWFLDLKTGMYFDSFRLQLVVWCQNARKKASKWAGIWPRHAAKCRRIYARVYHLRLSISPLLLLKSEKSTRKGGRQLLRGSSPANYCGSNGARPA